MERERTIICPKCKCDIRYDSMTEVIRVVDPDSYDEPNEFGRCWCQKCQHGTIPNIDGYCSTCIEKGVMFRLRPAPPKEQVEPIRQVMAETATEIKVEPVKEEPKEEPKTDFENKPKKVEEVKIVRPIKKSSGSSKKTL